MSIVLLISLIFGSLISGFIIVNIAYFVMVIIAERLVYFVLYVQNYVRNYRTKKHDTVNYRSSIEEVNKPSGDRVQRNTCQSAHSLISIPDKLIKNPCKDITNYRTYLDSNQDLYNFLPTIFFVKYLFHTRFGKHLLGYEYTSNENGKTTKLELNRNLIYHKLPAGSGLLSPPAVDEILLTISQNTVDRNCRP
jgi:hypothetical protein